MLNLLFKPHRGSLRAGTADVQKLFAMLKLIPQSDVAGARPPLAFALVIDSSGSMRQGSPLNKLDQAINAAHMLIDDYRLCPDDRVTVIHFDEKAKTLLPLTPLAMKHAAHDAVDGLRKFSGGTHMAKGLRCAIEAMSHLQPQVAKRVVVLTDGQTVDEDSCRNIASEFAAANTPLITIGIDAEYNEVLLRDVAELSQGRPYHLQTMQQLHEILDVEVESSVREVVTDLQMSIELVKGIQLDNVTRVYPSLAEVAMTGAMPYRLGNVVAGDYTVFILEFTIAGFPRPASRARIARLGLSGHIPGLNRRDELAPQDLFVNFTGDETATAHVEPEVLGYVQQKNVDRMVQEAVRLATTNAAGARQTLQAAIGMTQRLGNAGVSQMLTTAINELDRTGTISSGTRKTVSLGARTRTMKTGVGESLEGVPSEEEIRRLTGA